MTNSIHIGPATGKPILNQIFITAPDEPPTDDGESWRWFGCIAIAAQTQEEYVALVALKGECEKDAARSGEFYRADDLESRILKRVVIDQVAVDNFKSGLTRPGNPALIRFVNMLKMNFDNLYVGNG